MKTHKELRFHFNGEPLQNSCEADNSKVQAAGDIFTSPGWMWSGGRVGDCECCASSVVMILLLVFLGKKLLRMHERKLHGLSALPSY